MNTLRNRGMLAIKKKNPSNVFPVSGNLGAANSHPPNLQITPFTAHVWAGGRHSNCGLCKTGKQLVLSLLRGLITACFYARLAENWVMHDFLWNFSARWELTTWKRLCNSGQGCLGKPDCLPLLPTGESSPICPFPNPCNSANFTNGWSIVCRDTESLAEEGKQKYTLGRFVKLPKLPWAKKLLTLLHFSSLDCMQRHSQN